MKSIRKKRVQVLKFHGLSKYSCLEHCFTTKVGGVSKERYSSLNMGLNTEDDKEDVIKNYGLVAEEVFGASTSDMVLSNQVHKTDIAIVGESDRGKGFEKSFSYSGIDGLLTDRRGVVLSTVYADCTPLFFFDPVKEVVGVAHAGWRGTVGKIGKKMVEKMVLEYASHSKDIMVGIGPTIGPCCYEVGEEVYARFKEEFEDLSMMDILDNSIKLDLWKANKIGIMEAGVLEENIETGNYCTSCNPDLFYSYRRDNGITGRMAGVISLK